MTRYTVVWQRDAQDELTELWLDAHDRAAVTAAAHAIDVDLSQNAAIKGVEIAEGLRAFFAPPLRILYTVDKGDRLVDVVRVRRLSWTSPKKSFQRRPPNAKFVKKCISLATIQLITAPSLHKIGRP